MMAVIAAAKTRAATAPMTAIATSPICDGFDGRFDVCGGGVVAVELNCISRTGILHIVGQPWKERVISTYFPYNGANIAPCPGLMIIMSTVPDMDCGSSSPSQSRDIRVIYSVVAEREYSQNLISH